MAEKEITVKLNAFVSTPKGKAVILGISFALIALILFIPFYVYLGSKKTAKDDVKSAKPAADKAVSKTKEADGKALLPGTVESKSVPDAEPKEEAVEAVELYEFRDPFKPLDVPAAAAASQSSASSSSSQSSTETGGSVPLAVEDVYEEDGIMYATIHYGSTVYQVTEGTRVGDSPYEVLSIADDGVTLLYGDDQISLKVGEEIIK